MVRIVVLCPSRLYREGVARLLDGRGDIEVAATAADARTGLSVCAARLPDIAVLEWAVDGCLETVRALNRLSPPCRTVLLAAPDSEQEMLECAEAGVVGYATHDSSINDLAETILAAHRGELHCSLQFAGALIRRLATVADGRRVRPADALTQREQEVLKEIERGKSNKEIAVALRIEVATVKNHVHNVLEKIPARTRGEAAALYRRWRAISADGVLV